MTLYADSSAVLAWLLGQAGSAAVVSAMADADEVFASDLTLVECDRALIRAAALYELRASDVARQRRLLETAAHGWVVMRITPAIVERARGSFPGDPIRTLDALHLASALDAAEVSNRLSVLSLDHRVRRAARGLGLAVSPPRMASE